MKVNLTESEREKGRRRARALAMGVKNFCILFSKYAMVTGVAFTSESIRKTTSLIYSIWLCVCVCVRGIRLLQNQAIPFEPVSRVPKVLYSPCPFLFCIAFVISKKNLSTISTKWKQFLAVHYYCRSYCLIDFILTIVRDMCGFVSLSLSSLFSILFTCQCPHVGHCQQREYF